MYCPNCASANQTDVKFCRNCGISLRNVSAAFSFTTGEQSEEQHLANLIRKYYRGRDHIVRGGIMTATTLVLLMIMLATGKWHLSFYLLAVFLTGFVVGIRQIHKGLNDRGAAESELKVLGYQKPPVLTKRSSEDNSLRPIEMAERLAGINQPPSVTESTTRSLDQPGN